MLWSIGDKTYLVSSPVKHLEESHHMIFRYTDSSVDLLDLDIRPLA